jgi:threonine dehydrogenase-like Zn-dependent dehydrogenase
LPSWALIATLSANVSPVDTAAGSIVSYILGYGPIGIIALAFAFRFIVPRSAVDEAKEQARRDLVAENERLITEKTRAEEQRDDALKIAQVQLVPLLVQFTATTGALLPLLQELVTRREGHERGTGRG